jgi:hypothetical protein
VKKNVKKNLPAKEEFLDLLDEIVEVKPPAHIADDVPSASARGLGKESWSEPIELVSVSATGAGFNIGRECTVGSLVSLRVPLAAHLRCHDHESELYGVWGLVQYCLKSVVEGNVSYSVGVAFTGKNAPESYHRNPLQHYRVTGIGEDGLWDVTETNGFKVRRDMRYWRAVELYLSRVDARMQSIGGERTVTENISRSGAAVVSSLDVAVGDRVKFICERYDFSSLAVVCNKQEIDASKVRLHLKFVGATFPVEKVRTTAVKAGKVASKM